MVKAYAIVQIICIFLVSALLTTVIYLYFVFGMDLELMVMWFGGIYLKVGFFYLVALIGVICIAVVLFLSYYLELKSQTLVITKYEVSTYFIVSLMGILFVFITHSFHLPLSIAEQNLFLDIFIIIFVILIGLLIWILIQYSRHKNFFIAEV